MIEKPTDYPIGTVIRNYPHSAPAGKWVYRTEDPNAYVTGIFFNGLNPYCPTFEDENGMTFDSKFFEVGEYFERVE